MLTHSAKRRSLGTLGLGLLLLACNEPRASDELAQRLVAISLVQQQKITASDAANGARFGYSAAISADGQTAIVGAYSAAAGGTANAGQAYVYTLSGGVWGGEQKIMASDKANGLGFGIDVAISADGNTAIIGSRLATGVGVGTGAVYSYTRTAGSWGGEQKFYASDGAGNNDFGTALALSEDGLTAIVGVALSDPGGKMNAGAAYVYTKTAGTWGGEKKILPSDAKIADNFGNDVSLSADGNVALIGSIYSDDGAVSDAGAGYVYTRTAGNWGGEKKILASDRVANHSLGSSVSLSGDGKIALLGAMGATVGGASQAGAAYVFTESAGTWGSEKKIVASDGVANDRLGEKVALSSNGQNALLGAPQAAPGGKTNAGAVYGYSFSGGSWGGEQKILASDGAASDIFGTALGISGSGAAAIVGALQAAAGATPGAGAAYTFTSGSPNGTACTMGSSCASGNCVDGFCCDTTCGGGSDADCQACSAAKKQSGMGDGTCGAAKTTFTCPATGPCDNPVSCDGSSMACPTRSFKASGTLCRAAAGPCDAVENCNGSMAACPGDARRPKDSTCRAAAGTCDAAELCDGSTINCPIDMRKPAGTLCKAAGASTTCDPADVCDGNRTSCPANFAPYGMSCGTAMSCNGTGRCL